ncbi:MAG: hypothetical protein DRP66_10565 [Planctomycetota bacterium]|nr:MAG: hypothetical protein DRP66_10565 [Planctomycetota bacterium]
MYSAISSDKLKLSLLFSAPTVKYGKCPTSIIRLPCFRFSVVYSAGPVGDRTEHVVLFLTGACYFCRLRPVLFEMGVCISPLSV